MINRRFFILLSFLLLGACSSTRSMLAQMTNTEPCRDIDWFERGRSDGMTGKPISELEKHRQRCDKTPQKVNVEFYEIGRETGLIEYCSTSTGVEMGRTGKPYLGVCPWNLEKNFLHNYAIGNRIREIETENASIILEVESLTAQRFSPARLRELRQRQARNQERIMTLEESTQRRPAQTSVQ